MAIYIGLRKVEEDEGLKIFEFFRSDGSVYGHIAVDKTNGEASLLDAIDERGEKFAFPRARRVIQREWEKGGLPDEFYYAA
jgi:hypothetical protein